MKNFFNLIRVKHWIKNLFVFAPLLFSKNLFNKSFFLQTFVSFILLSLLTSGLYVFNDIKDLENDKLHPAKKERPLAKRLFSKNFALIISILFISISLIFSFFLNYKLTLLFIFYIFINILYTIYFKKIVIIDVFVIALNFILRILTGSIATGINISSWLILCTLFLSLFLGFSKRRFEIISLKENANRHREVLSSYSVDFLDKIIVVLSTSTILSYALYTVSTETKEKFGESLVYTIPFVVYGILRYLYLIYKTNEGEPTKLVTSDIPLILTITFWIITSIIFIYR
ncbi:MAG TPA: decaprenyl-phosphate phosphoribosyltransferase [Caldisericia bacterium]|nr:decaprenyl-phosphate phosphoribosyltransferase [Caldisericia bacterium]HOL82803.1 decaprenyl-phosphate phosphoribosyltransferase [Caldisericia bacterium]HPC56770.1 decaprenyl-phosphate phosphoribosyltransferase [Caldisericia bacterium]HPP43610.1 decaprenyl-phosphate phosphoribosyltransferase [Caldisericia bacterium]HRT37157.1 decaprenyl-phosphate phosphoribosyltransferase [Caldisericia bacterium]